jgi:hypothetical protein
VEVYSRWGEKVFESDHLAFDWDGVYGLKPLDSAVFAYMINATLKNGVKIKRKGNVSLIR